MQTTAHLQTTPSLLAPIRNLLAFRTARPRRTQIYGIGTAKSGTHFLDSLFRSGLRSAHEPESNELIEVILAVANERMADAELDSYLRERDERLSLEVDASQLNIFILDRLIDLFPESRFILTIREPRAWLDSFINHQLTHATSQQWISLRDFRFHPDLYTHQPGEMILQEHGLYTLDGYLAYWARHNQAALATVPKERLLIARTDQLSKRSDELASFVGAPAGSLRPANAHAFAAQQKFGLLDKVDQRLLAQKLNEYCGHLAGRLFPEVPWLSK